LTVRPVKRQVFHAAELLDMILCVTGKDAVRVQHILRTGSLVFHFYRYRWEPIEAHPTELESALSAFPDADPSRAFRAEECTAVLVVPRGGTGGQAASAPGHAVIPSNALEILRAEAQAKRLFSGRSLWDEMMDLARARASQYAGYSYALRGDVYGTEISSQEGATLARSAEKHAPRSMRGQAAKFAAATRLLFVCPRHDAGFVRR
jgi:hypothetical protein